MKCRGSSETCFAKVWGLCELCLRGKRPFKVSRKVYRWGSPSKSPLTIQNRNRHMVTKPTRAQKNIQPSTTIWMEAVTWKLFYVKLWTSVYPPKTHFPKIQICKNTFQTIPDISFFGGKKKVRQLLSDISELWPLRNAPKTVGNALEWSGNNPERLEMSENVRKSPKIIRKRPKIIRKRPKIG